MDDNRRMISLGLSAQLFPAGQHICYIYNDDAERLDVMAKYLMSGMEEREKLLYLVDVMTSSEMLDHLDKLGVNFRSANPADFTIAEATPTYCPDGFFKPEDMLDLARNFHLDAIKEGYAGARGTGEMSWCLKEEGVDHFDLMDYEARLNDLIQTYYYNAC